MSEKPHTGTHENRTAARVVKAENSERQKVYRTKRRIRNALKISLVCVVLLFIIYQVYRAYFSSVVTEMTNTCTEYETIGAQALFVRNEHRILEDEYNEIAVNAVGNCERVAAGDPIAYAFEDSAMAEDYIYAEKLDYDIEYLSQLRAASGGSYLSDPEMVSGEIKQSLIDLAEITDSDDLGGLSETKQQLRDYINRRKVFTEDTGYIEDALLNAANEREKLPADGEWNYNVIRAPFAGTFMDNTDGYETAFEFEGLLDVYPDELDSMMGANPDSTGEEYMGRLIDGYNWYILCNVDSQKCGTLKQGSSVDIIIPSLGDERVAVYIEAMNRDGDVTTLVFRCNTVTAELLSLRKETIKIVENEYDGLKIDPRSIRVNEDGDYGVYALVGNVVRWRDINIIYQTEEYAVVEKLDTSLEVNSGYLHLYDEVVVEGKNLYDGKIV